MSYILDLTATEVEERLKNVPVIGSKVFSLDEVALDGQYIKVTVDHTIQEGTEIKFKAPVSDSNDIIGLRVAYKDNDNITTKDFTFVDAHGNNVGEINNLFAKDAIVKVVLGLDNESAFVQNADTNAYLESRFDELKEGYETYVDSHVPDISSLIDQTYNADSESAQSGKAVAEAVADAVETAVASKTVIAEITETKEQEVLKDSGQIVKYCAEEGEGESYFKLNFIPSKIEIKHGDATELLVAANDISTEEYEDRLGNKYILISDNSITKKVETIEDERDVEATIGLYMGHTTEETGTPGEDYTAEIYNYIYITYNSALGDISSVDLVAYIYALEETESVEEILVKKFSAGDGISLVYDETNNRVKISVDPSSMASGVSHIVEEAGIGNDWIYRKWSSGKCELSRNITVDQIEEDNIVLETPFLVTDLIPFITVTDGDVSFYKNVTVNEDSTNNKTIITISFDKGTVRKLSARIEGLWK